MGETNHDGSDAPVLGEPAEDRRHIPSFELIPRDAQGEGAASFDFGPDLNRPAGAPVAVAPPWMGADLAAGPVDHRRARVPRSRRHRRVEPELATSARLPGARRGRREEGVEVAEVAAPQLPRIAGPRRTTEDGPARVLVAPAPDSVVAETILITDDPNEPPAAAPRTSRGRGRRRRAALVVVLGLGALGGVGVAGLGDSLLGENSAPVELSVSQAAARDWVEANLGPKAAVLAPTDLVASLQEMDFDASRLFAYGNAANLALDWRCCNVLVATASVGDRVRDALPSRLRGGYDRSRLMATFTLDGAVTEVRQVLDGSPAQVRVALKAEQAARVAAGKEIVELDRVVLSKAARASVLAGKVDSRVLLAVVGLARYHEVRVAAFPIEPAGNAAGSVARIVRIDRLGGEPLTADGRATSDAFEFLDIQVAPYRPLDVVLAEDGRSAELVITYDAPGPLGLITPRRAAAS